MTDKRVALVTGSSSGIGANIAIDLASQGYFIIATGRDQQKLDQIKARCNEISNSDSSVSFRADLHEQDQVDELVRFVRLKFKRLDVLINNACWRGDQQRNLVTKMTYELVSGDKTKALFDDFVRVMRINVSVPMYLIQQCALLKHQQQTDDVVVVNISSIASQTVVPLHTYSISKACLSELSRQLAKVGQNLGIRSITVSPGPILTDERPQHQTMSNMTLLNRVGTTQEISNLVTFAIQNAHLFNGQELYIDGGYLAKQRQVASVSS